MAFCGFCPSRQSVSSCGHLLPLRPVPPLTPPWRPARPGPPLPPRASFILNSDSDPFKGTAELICPGEEGEAEGASPWGGDRGQEKFGVPLAVAPELGGQAVPPPLGERGFPACSQGGGTVIPQNWPSAGPESPDMGRPCFLLGHFNRALAQRPTELGKPPCVSCLLHFLEHPQLPLWPSRTHVP